MRTLYSFIIPLLILIAGPAFAEQTMTLEQCLTAGLVHSPTLKASRLSVESASSDIKINRADLLPTLSASYSLTDSFNTKTSGPADPDYLEQSSRSFTVKLSQTLYAGSRVVNSYQRAKYIKQVSEAQLRLAELELAYNIKTTFFRLMKARADSVSAAESVSRLKKSVKSAEAFLQKQLVPYVDVLKTRVDLADAKNQLGLAKNNENRQREALFSLMDLPMDRDIRFTVGEYQIYRQKPTFEECFQYAIENRPDLKSLQYQLLAANKQATIASGKYLPTATFNIGYYTRDNDYDYLREDPSGGDPIDQDQYDKYMMAGLTLSWDLFDGGRGYYEFEKYTFESKKFRALAIKARNMISTGIRKALYSMSEAEQRLESSKEGLIAANENYTSEVNRLAAGVSTIQNLLGAQIRLVLAEANKTNAMFDYQLARSELIFMTGGDIWKEEVIDE